MLKHVQKEHGIDAIMLLNEALDFDIAVDFYVTYRFQRCARINVCSNVNPMIFNGIWEASCGNGIPTTDIKMLRMSGALLDSHWQTSSAVRIRVRFSRICTPIFGCIGWSQSRPRGVE